MNLRQRIWQKRKKQPCHFRLRGPQCCLKKQITSSKCFLLSSLPFGLLPLYFRVHDSLLYLLLFLLTHPCFFFYHSLSLNELPSDYWGFWRSIRNMCEGLEAADGKSSVKQLTLISPKEPEPAGKKNSQPVQRHKLIGFYRILFSTERINRKKLLTLNQSV